MDSRYNYLLLLENLTIRGREEDEGTNDSTSEEEEEEEEEEENSSESSEKGGSDDEAENLRKALAEERKLRRKAEREAKRKSREKAQSEKSEKDAEFQQRYESEKQRAERLAQGFLAREIDSAIREEARRQGFIDETDALTDEIRRAVEADQDEEDPTDIDIDLDSVQKAVKELAARKKHLVGKASPTERSGGKFRKKGSSRDDELTSDQAMIQNYPSLA